MVVLGVTRLGEHLTKGKVVGTSLASVGTLVVLLGQYEVNTFTNGNLIGVGLLLFSAFSFAAFSAFAKPLIERYSALETATYATVLSVPLFAALVPFELYLRPSALGSVTLPVIGAVLYLALMSTAAAWYCWYKGMEYADASTVAVYFFAQPIVGILLGSILLGESIDLSIVSGGIPLVLGVFLVNKAG
jgi:drug/metabolite transporter (DMT)-like permease